MFEKIKAFFEQPEATKTVTPEEAKKIEDAKKLNETADEMMKGDTASPEVSESEEETTTKENDQEKE